MLLMRLYASYESPHIFVIGFNVMHAAHVDISNCIIKLERESIIFHQSFKMFCIRKMRWTVKYSYPFGSCFSLAKK